MMISFRLTDEEARKTWEEFGHPDGKQAFQLGLALPSWLVEAHNSSLVLLVYGLAFGIALPVVVARWWRNAKIMSKNQVQNETMGIFYRELQDNVLFKGLLEILVKAEEFQGMDFGVQNWGSVCEIHVVGETSIEEIGRRKNGIQSIEERRQRALQASCATFGCALSSY
jgi:preprotein translocase subunit Sec63